MDSILTKDRVVRNRRPLLPEERAEITRNALDKFLPVPPADPAPLQICRHCFSAKTVSHSHPCGSYDPRAPHAESIKGMSQTPFALAAMIVFGVLITIGVFYLAFQTGDRLKPISIEKRK